MEPVGGTGSLAGHEGRRGRADARISPDMATLCIIAATTLARSAGYDVVLLAHVLCALVGLGAVVVAGGCGWALLRSGQGSEALRRYYRPGVNWAGRIIDLVPVFGVALIGMSRGAWSFSDGWISIGLVLWAVAASVGELALWPAERRLQQAVSHPDSTLDVRADCITVVVAAAVITVVVVVATVVMVGKP